MDVTHEDDVAAAVARIEAAGLVAVPAREGRRQRRSKTADTNDRRTPRWLFERAAARFGPFDLDGAAHAGNTLVSTWLGPGSAIAEDALAIEWSLERILGALDSSADDALVRWLDLVQRFGPLSLWINPPYGPTGTIPRWLAHAKRQRDQWGTRSTFLLPGDYSVEWLRACVREGEIVENLPYRVAFDAPDGSTHNHRGRPNSALSPSVIVHIAPTWGTKDRAPRARAVGVAS